MISAKARILSYRESWSAQAADKIAADPLASRPDQTGWIRAPFFPADDSFRPIFTDVIAATIVGAAPNQAIAPHGIAQARPDFDGLNPHENGRVPKNGTESGSR
jgi:hypothetical protein